MTIKVTACHTTQLSVPTVLFQVTAVTFLIFFLTCCFLLYIAGVTERALRPHATRQGGNYTDCCCPSVRAGCPPENCLPINKRGLCALLSASLPSPISLLEMRIQQ